jgi:hypothetical protein
MSLTEFASKLTVFASGVDALRGSKEHAILAPLLANDLMVYRRMSGLAEAFPEDRLKASQRAAENNLKRLLKVGPILWEQMHRRALRYNGTTKDEEPIFLQKLVGQLPCGECKDHAIEYIDANPQALESAETYFAWTVAFHNHVNLTKENPSEELTVQQAYLRWK